MIQYNNEQKYINSHFKWLRQFLFMKIYFADLISLAIFCNDHLAVVYFIHEVKSSDLDQIDEMKSRKGFVEFITMVFVL